jgi:hypothetical protein
MASTDRDVLHLKHVPEFRGGDVVLLAADHEGLAAFHAALKKALQTGESRLQRSQRSHQFVIDDGAADIHIGDRSVWRLDHHKAQEIADKAHTLLSGAGTGHHYVDDMRSPAHTLVISLNEYITPSWLTTGREPAFSDENTVEQGEAGLGT